MFESTSIEVSLDLPWVTLKGTWTPSRLQKKAAWELYVELVTRVSTVPLEQDEGLIREAMTSLHGLFGIMREILKRYGPSLAKPRKGRLSLGLIAGSVLNSGIRPLLSRWHPRLEDYEARRPEGVSRWQHECQWEHSGEVREALDGLRRSLVEYARLLEVALSIPERDSLLIGGRRTSVEMD